LGSPRPPLGEPGDHHGAVFWIDLCKQLKTGSNATRYQVGDQELHVRQLPGCIDTVEFIPDRRKSLSFQGSGIHPRAVEVPDLAGRSVLPGTRVPGNRPDHGAEVFFGDIIQFGKDIQGTLIRRYGVA